MKVISKEDKNSSKYIIDYDVEKGVIQKNKRKNATAVEITTEKFNNLVVTMADGSKPRYLNIEENEKKILKLMWQQQNRNKAEIDKLKKQILTSKICSGISIFLTTVIGCWVFLGIEAGVFNSLFTVGPTILAACSISQITKYFKDIKSLKEVLKNEHLRENNDDLNSINLDNPNILLNVKKKQIKEIKRIRKSKEEQKNPVIFDINSIDKLSLETLRQIKENIERDNYLGLVTSSEKVKENDCKQYKKSID